MNLVADESVSGPVIRRLRDDGHIVEAIREVAAGIQDDEVLHRAASSGRILLTEDKDFGGLVFRKGQPHAGVVLLRLSELPMDQQAETVSQLLQTREAELANAFTVVDSDGVRIRPAPP